MTKLSDIAALLGETEIPPEVAAREIRGVAALLNAGATDISFLASEQFTPQIRATRAAAVIVSRKLRIPDDFPVTVLRVDDAELGIARVLEHFAPPISRPPTGVDPAARVDPTAVIGHDAAIGPFVSIGARSRVGARTIIHTGAFVGDDVMIGDECELFPNVVMRERITLGNRVTIHAGSAVGSDGFGYRWDGKRHAKIPQIGTVIVEDDVEIGSCTCVDRAKFGVTRIGRGTKIDNLVHVAHNCSVGPNCILVAHVALAGSVTLGAGVVLGGKTSVRDHVTMGDGAIGAACSSIAADVPAGMVVSGTPASAHRQNLRELTALHKLPDLLKEFRNLQNEIELLKAQLAQR